MGQSEFRPAPHPIDYLASRKIPLACKPVNVVFSSRSPTLNQACGSQGASRLPAHFTYAHGNDNRTRRVAGRLEDGTAKRRKSAQVCPAVKGAHRRRAGLQPVADTRCGGDDASLHRVGVLVEHFQPGADERTGGYRQRGGRLERWRRRLGLLSGDRLPGACRGVGGKVAGERGPDAGAVQHDDVRDGRVAGAGIHCQPRAAPGGAAVPRE